MAGPTGLSPTLLIARILLILFAATCLDIHLHITFRHAHTDSSRFLRAKEHIFFSHQFNALLQRRQIWSDMLSLLPSHITSMIAVLLFRTEVLHTCL